MKCLALWLCAVALFAQAPHVELRGSIGVTSFLDDASQNHLLLAPAVRYHFTPHIAVEGEFQYLRQNSSHRDYAFLPSFVYEFRQGRVVPYVSAGVGVVRSSFSYTLASRLPVGSPSGSFGFSETEVFGQIGGGVKLYLNDHWYVSPDFRVGYDIHARVSGAVGYTWRR